MSDREHGLHLDWRIILGMTVTIVWVGVGLLYLAAVFGPTGTQDMTLDEFSTLRSEASRGDHGLFIRLLTTAAVDRDDDPEALHDMLFGTGIRRRHAENFMTTFGRLLKAAEEIDSDGMVERALLQGSSAGFYYRLLRYVAGAEAVNPISGMPGSFADERASARGGSV
jgi:hypothetical protein